MGVLRYSSYRSDGLICEKNIEEILTLCAWCEQKTLGHCHYHSFQTSGFS
jgi:hypothetical protein